MEIHKAKAHKHPNAFRRVVLLCSYSFPNGSSSSQVHVLRTEGPESKKANCISLGLGVHVYERGMCAFLQVSQFKFLSHFWACSRCTINIEMYLAESWAPKLPVEHWEPHSRDKVVFAIKNMVSGPTTFMVPGIQEKCKALGPITELLNQNSPFNKNGR